jgi:hypothetical protein
MVQKHGWVVMSGRLNSDLNIGNRLPASFLNIAIAKRCCVSDSEALASLRASAVATLGASAQIALSKTLPSNEQPLSKLIGYAFLRRAIAG